MLMVMAATDARHVVTVLVVVSMVMVVLFPA
jgi:hypothetical protein